ncbi:MAG: beta-galactosidase precursor [Frankiales bacterium]|nr:beta-galactosidase precursor [Frankiales bacterium]
MGAYGLAVSGGALASLGPARRAPTVLPGLHSTVFGGELQYFRMSQAATVQRLALCEQAAFSVIQTYVPWNVHENAQGQLDFRGRTSPVIVSDHADEYQIETPDTEIQDGGLAARVVANTDLASFLTECKRRRLAVILRPGPFISDEWRNGGIPDWLLAQGLPSMYQYGPDGTALTPGTPLGSPLGAPVGGGPLFYFPSPSYASDFYLAAAKGWLTSFAAFAKPWLASNGGPVVGVQVDDETCYFYRFGAFECDYNPAMLQRWRQAHPGSDAPRAWPARSAGATALRPALAWQAFKGEQAADYLGTLAAALRRAKVDVPITHETELSLTPSGDMTAYARKVLLTPEFYSGGSSAKTLPANELTAQAVRAASRNRTVPWATEMNNNDIGLYDLLIGEGIVGGLQFTYTQGVPDGGVADLGRLGRTLRTAGPALAAGRRRSDVAIVWDNTLASYPYDTLQRGFATDVRRTFDNHLPALAALLVQAGYAFDLLDVHAAEPADYDDYPTIFLVATDVLPASAQRALVRYVRRGGRLVCAPTIPTYSGDLTPCHTLRDACFPDPPGRVLANDAQPVTLLGRPVTLWRGTRTYRLSPGSRPVAFAGTSVCGYSRRIGAGEAVLIGGLLAADSVIGREGEILDEEQLPAANAGVATARGLAERAFGSHGAALAALLPTALPTDATSVIAYQYSNQRRGGDVISGGAIATWNGTRVTGIAELNTAETAPALVAPFPDHPIEAEHIAAIRRLAVVRPHVAVSDSRVQARVLDGPRSGTATVSAVNRSQADVDVTFNVQVDGRDVRLPTSGAVHLPAGSGILLPIGYRVGGGVTVRQASCQLVTAQVTSGQLRCDVWSPAGGELVLDLPGRSSPVRLVAPAGDATVRTRL